MESLLRASVLDLGYGVPPEKLKTSELYVRSDKPTNEDEIKRLIQRIRILHAAYDGDDDNAYQIKRAFSDIYHLCGINNDLHNIANCHPLILSVMIHFIYLESAGFFSDQNVFFTSRERVRSISNDEAHLLLSSIDERTLTDKECQRLNLAKAATILKSNKPIGEKLDSIKILLSLEFPEYFSNLPENIKLEALSNIICFDGCYFKPEFLQFIISKQKIFHDNLGASFQLFRLNLWERLAIRASFCLNTLGGSASMNLGF